MKATGKGRARPRLNHSIRFGPEWQRIVLASRILAVREGVTATPAALVRSSSSKRADEIISGATPAEIRAAEAMK